MFPDFSSSLLLNDKPCKITYPFKNGDAIVIAEAVPPTVEMIANKLGLALEEKIVVSFQQETLELKKVAREVMVSGESVMTSSTVANGASLSIIEKDTKPWIYQDIFRYSNWQLPVNFKGQFTILRNGEPSSFDAEIFGGDQLEIILTEQTIQ